MNSIIFWPYLVGLVPILLARTWAARRVAILFGAVLIGICLYHLRLNYEFELSPFRRTIVPLFGALITALVSAIVTYRLDRKHDPKA